MERTATDFSRLRTRLAGVMQVDRHRLTQRLRGLEERHRKGDDVAAGLVAWEEQLERSRAKRAARAAAIPALKYDDALPITARREEIVAALKSEQVIVLCGETGSGKSTQLPKMCLEAGLGIGGLIGHTQPRRIAARSIAARVAEELGGPVGKQVGFKIRFTDSTNENTFVKLMTDGILLAESQTDRFLDAYEAIIIDEAHERSLNIDFLLGFLKQLLPRRPDLKLVITSATIDAERFAEHFRSSRGPAPIILVSGRTFPVEVRYRPPAEDADPDRDWSDGVIAAIDELAREGRGDMLVFLPTERDIHELTRILKGRTIPGDGGPGETKILPLYARLPTQEQNEIFSPGKRRRIVLATNVAESSLTVPNIEYCIDVGTQRISRYSVRSKIQRLPIEAISQASADQRKGRCGRVAPGVCIRLYSEEDFLGRDRFTQPEILRTNLASVILQTKNLRFGEIEDFPFLDPPRPDAIRDGYKTLFELRAIDAERNLTDLGRRLGKLPVDPRIGRIILEGDREGCLHEILILAAALETQDPRERPFDQQGAADAAHARFKQPESDFISYLKLWEFQQHLKETISRSQFRKACKQNFLSANRLREWCDVHLQLSELVQEAGLKITSRKDDYAALHRALLAGFLASIATQTPEGDYLVAGGGKAHLWPGSGCLAKKPKWTVAAEFVETTRCYLRTAARIDPAWIEPLADHLVQKTYHDPFWNEKSGRPMVQEKIVLMGLTIVQRRPVPLAPVNRAEARRIFVQHALVNGEMPNEFPFLTHNRALEKQLTELQVRSRRAGWLLGEEALVEFYQERLPDDVFDVVSLEKFLRTAAPEQRERLKMREADLLAVPEMPVTAAAFPDAVAIRTLQLPLTYKLEPGAADDGVTMVVPREGLNQVDPRRLGWVVPGLAEEKITALVKSLPKDLRRHFVPIPDTAKKIVNKLKFGEGCLVTAVAAELSREAGIPIRPSDFQEDRIPDHLLLNVRVVDPQGQVLAESRRWETLRQEIGGEAATGFTEIAAADRNRDGVKTWDFGDLPDTVPVPYRGLEMIGRPAVVDQGDAVGLRLFDCEVRCRSEHRLGMQKLMFLLHNEELLRQVKHLPSLEMWKKQAAGTADAKDLRTRLALRLAERATWADEEPPRTAAGVQEMSKRLRKRLPLAVQELSAVLGPLFQALHAAKHALDHNTAPQWRPVLDDAREQFELLTAPEFLVRTPWSFLQHFPRYFKGIAQRIERLPGNGLARDLKELPRIRGLQQQYLELRRRQEQAGIVDPEADAYRRLLEEFRVSVFAQALGTAHPVSEKRLAKQWELIRAT